MSYTILYIIIFFVSLGNKFAGKTRVIGRSSCKKFTLTVKRKKKGRREEEKKKKGEKRKKKRGG